MDTADPAEHVDLIRQVLGYITRFKGGVFVLKIDDPIISHRLSQLMAGDICLLHQMGIRVVIVPGARHRVDEVLDRYDLAWKMVDGIRISTPQMIPFIKMAAFDVSNKIMTLLAKSGANAVIGNWVRARSIGVRDGVDFQSSGVVDSLNTEIIERVLADDMIPIFPTIGWSSTGQPYNISSNELAHALAVRLGARKLFFVNDSEPVSSSRYRIPESLGSQNAGVVSRMTHSQAAEFLELNAERRDDSLMDLLRVAQSACRDGVPRVHIVNGSAEGAILREVFSNLGAGTMIYADTHMNIRPLQRDDIPYLLRIMAPLVEQGILVERTAETMAPTMDDYVVYEIDGSVHAGAALHTFDDSAEIAALTVDPAYASLQIGRKLATWCMGEARRRGLQRVFVLTTQTSDWFDSLGFTPGTVEDLPAARRATYDTKRRPRVLLYNVADRGIPEHR